MATINVDITEREILYPDGNRVHRGDTVNFRVMGIAGDVTVTFDTPCCFTSPDPLLFTGLTLASSALQVETVSSSASAGNYHFTADIPDAARKKFPNWEAKRGDLDVTTDEPEEDARKPR
ncbi:MAG TPA: hypothetical protein VFZ09_24935 [Archangium sp.]|uniref:hypothetical protein n=1 Tax=Archangium sp. TaxID=1872627 RepID=UPI002E2F01E7|nr:hypothetical protein [Archangium sp.]HEX5749498.1 hypothetical protein [Archangium sp.]